MSWNTDLLTIAKLKAEAEERARRKAEERAKRRRDRDLALAKIRAEHAAACARPLIAEDLLTPDEREAIRAKVRAKQRWQISGELTRDGRRRE